MRDNPIQFAVVREDPLIVSDVVGQFGVRRALLIASGGCTALSLKSEHPHVDVTLLDPNPAQLQLVQEKIDALTLPLDSFQSLFNVEDDSPAGLNQRGNFESLFRGLRTFLQEFVLPQPGWERLFDPATSAPEVAVIQEEIFASPYWPVAFEIFFHDALLNTMFGEDATQHATPGSYPLYFQTRFELGLQRPDAKTNYFLHHVLLGHYLVAALPIYLAAPPVAPSFETRIGFVQEVEDIAQFDLVDLSNIMDWMGEEKLDALGERLRKMRPGSVILYRQLNNQTDHEARLSDTFHFDESLAEQLMVRDRSLFYESIHVGIHTPP